MPSPLVCSNVTDHRRPLRHPGRHRVFGFPELRALIIAQHCEFVGAFRRMLLCKAASQRAKEWLRTLPGLLVCGGLTPLGNRTSEAWRSSRG